MHFLNQYEIFTIGKYKGSRLQSVAAMDPNYIEWIAKTTTSSREREMILAYQTPADPRQLSLF